MAKLTLEQLQALRREKQAALAAGTSVVILVGTGTCGIAAGARETMRAIEEEIEREHVAGAQVKTTGCMGMCYSEPTVEVLAPGMPDTVYGRVNEEIGRRIVKEHLVGRRLVSEYVYDRPSADVFKPQQ
jgi:NADP-reducing hydrogenase subunit HndB